MVGDFAQVNSSSDSESDGDYKKKYKKEKKKNKELKKKQKEGEKKQKDEKDKDKDKDKSKDKDKDKKPKAEEEKKEESKETPQANDESKKKIESLQKELKESKSDCANKPASNSAPSKKLAVSRTILEIFGTVHAGRILEKHKNIPAVDIYTPNWQKNKSYDQYLANARAKLSNMQPGAVLRLNCGTKQGTQNDWQNCRKIMHDTVLPQWERNKVIWDSTSDVTTGTYFVVVRNGMDD